MRYARTAGLGADLDHVAVAVEHQRDAWSRYGGDLAGRWVGGGESVGFASAQVAYPDPDRAMKVEVLEPHRVADNDFLRRFLDRHGPGAHHLTFKVPDIRRALRAARRQGLEPVAVDLTNPDWMEAFLMPKQACGIVVQLAQSGREWDEPGPSPLPAPRVAQPAVLARIELLVADLGVAQRLFCGLLGGGSGAKATLYARADDRPWWSGRRGPRGGLADAAAKAHPPGSSSDVDWPGGGRIRLLQPEPGTAEAEWLGDRPGRLDHLCFRVGRPRAISGARAMGDGRYEVPRAANHGVRLVLVPAHG